MQNMTGGFQLTKKKLIVLVSCIGMLLILAPVLSSCTGGGTTTPTATTPTPTTTATSIVEKELTYNFLNPKGTPASGTAPQRIAFTGTLLAAQTFFEATTNVASLGNAPIAQWTDGLPIAVPTEQKVKEMLTGTSHKSTEKMAAYSKDSSGKWVKSSTSASFAPSGWQATVEQVAINAVMAGCKPEYLPAVLAMASVGLNYKAGTSPTGYVQIVAGPYSKEVGFNAGQGAMNPGNPPSMTIGRAYELMLVNLGGAIAGSTNTNLGNAFNRANLCYAEDTEALPTGWIGMNLDVGFASTESAIMLCQAGTSLMSTFAPSSFRATNSGAGGIAEKLGVVGKPGFYNIIEYLMQWSLMTDLGPNSVPGAYAGAIGPQGPLTFTMHPDVALSLKDFGFNSKMSFYNWVYDRTVMNLSDFKKNGWYNVLTNNGAAIEPTSGKAYNTLADTYKIHIYGAAKDQLAIVSCSPGDETIQTFSGGRGIPICIDNWK